MEQDDKNEEIKENKENEVDLENDNLKIEDNKVNEENEENKKDEFEDWVFYNGEDVISINLEDNSYQKDVLDDYEIIESFDEKNDKVETSKKIEV